MRHGETVSALEREIAAYCGARFAVCASNGTVTIQAALVALGIKQGQRVSTSPLTMSATTIAILNVGGIPVFEDVNPQTWLIEPRPGTACDFTVPVSLYGLHQPFVSPHIVDDAAQTLRPHGGSAFTSLSFQKSKILSTQEGGALLTDDADFAEAARSYLSLGYQMNGQARIDSGTLKSPTFDRHHRYPSINGRMNDLTAAEGLSWLAEEPGYDGRRYIDRAKTNRVFASEMYKGAITCCDWLTPQRVPEGWTHDMWAYAVACDTPERAIELQAKMRDLGAEVPYGCWKVTYREPAFHHLNPPYIHVYAGRDGGHHAGDFEPRAQMYPCPVAESLQPRILAFQTNDLTSAERNATALRRAIEELS